MSTKKVEIDPALAAATKAKEAAIKARAKANHSTAVVHVSAQALTAAQSAAAQHHIEAAQAEAEAIRHADLARKALEESLGIVPSHEDHHTAKEPEAVEEKPKE